MELKARLPYPSLKEIGEDYRALRVLSPAYAGSAGELTAVLQYVYQSIIFGKLDMGEYARQLLAIAANEMRHLELLGTAISLLGAPPVYTARPPYPVGYYSASNVNYSKTPAEMISADIAAEQSAVAEYRRMLPHLDGTVADLVNRILKDEEMHLAAFEAIGKELTHS